MYIGMMVGGGIVSSCIGQIEASIKQEIPAAYRCRGYISHLKITTNFTKKLMAISDDLFLVILPLIEHEIGRAS